MIVNLNKKLVELNVIAAKKCDADNYNYLFIMAKNGYIYTISTDMYVLLFCKHDKTDLPEDKMYQIPMKSVEEYIKQAKDQFTLSFELTNNDLMINPKPFFKMVPDELKLNSFDYMKYQIRSKHLEKILKINNKLGKNSDVYFYPYRDSHLIFVRFNQNNDIFGVVSAYEVPDELASSSLSV